MFDEEVQECRKNYFLDVEENLLSKGDDLQKLSVIGSLPELFRLDSHGTVTRIIPKIQQELPNSTSEFNLCVSKMFNVLMHMDVPVNLVPQVLQGIENKDPVIANAWMETLLAVIPILKESVVKNDILKCAVSKSQLSKAAYFRVSSCKILGKISVHKCMSPFDVKKDVLPLVQSLCQDCFHEVRAAMCKELPNIAQGLYNLGDAIVRVNLLPLLVELSSDENIYVRSVAIDSVVLIIPYLSSETVKGTIIPLTKKLCTRSVSEGDTTYTSIAKVFGKLIGNLQSQFTSSDSMWFLDYYSHICKKGLSLLDDLDTDPAVSMICRESCALSLPIVASLVLNEIPNEINTKWYLTFKDLSADPCYIVRKAVASCFAETVQILGSCNKLVIIDFTKLLRDEDEEVLQSIVPHIGLLLELFAISGVLTRDLPVQATLDVGRAMLKCQAEVFKTNNWRMKESILKQFERLPCCMPSDFIHQHFTPVVLNTSLKGKAKPVRSQATRTLLIILRYNLKENHRKWIRENMINQLCNSSCCYTRQVFVTLCTHAINIFSWRYFKEHFYLPLLTLAEDQVSNVRLCVVKLCPILKQMLILPVDRPLQLKLENIMSKLEMMESDKDIMRTLKLKLKEMRSFQVNKNDVIIEERRRIDEEDNILKGKIGFKFLMSGQKTDATADSTKESDKFSDPITVPRSGQRPTSRLKPVGVNSSMSFLDQHFYIDAGVSFPKDLDQNSDNFLIKDQASGIKRSNEVDRLIKSTENMFLNPTTSEMLKGINPSRRFENKEMVISVENINIDSLSERDLKELETTTTNITDDVKANIQKISKEGEFKKRSKRSSCAFETELKNNCMKNTESLLKRRSLNIGNLNDSRIPICSKAGKRLSFCQRFRSVSDQNLDLSSKCERISGLPKLKTSLDLKKNDVDAKITVNNKDSTTLCNNVSKMSSSYNDENVNPRLALKNKSKNHTSSCLNNDRNVGTKESKLVIKVSNLPVSIRKTEGKKTG